MDYEAAKRMEDFAKEILRQTPAMQKKMWEALEPVLTADEVKKIITNCPDYETRVKMLELVCEQFGK